MNLSISKYIKMLIWYVCFAFLLPQLSSIILSFCLEHDNNLSWTPDRRIFALTGIKPLVPSALLPCSGVTLLFLPVFMSFFFPTCRCISVNLAAELISQLGLRHVNLTEKGRMNVAPVTENLQNLRSDKTIYTQSHHLSFTSRRQLWLCVESLCLFWSVLLTRWLLSVRRAAGGSRQFNGLPHVLQRISLIVTIWCSVTEMDQNMYLPLIFVYTIYTLYIAMPGF